jgi:opacity protein-like surface antigen
MALAMSAPSTAATDPASVDVPLLSRAQEWLQQGQGRRAYGMLEPHEASLAGAPVFDYLFGQAALAADQPTRAALAFERCLATQPGNGACRLGMARAHIALTEVEGARMELATISSSSPPAEVQSAVATYLGLLANVQEGSYDSRLSSYIEMGAGYDSNFNSATSLVNMALPAFGGAVFTLSRDGRRRSSGLNQAAFNLRYSTAVAQDWRLFVETNIAATGNWATHDYNTLVSDANIGVIRRADKHQFSARAQAQNYVLGGHSYRNTVGVLGQYAYSVSQRSEFSAFAQASHLNYPDFRLRDVRRYTGGVSWSQALASDRAVAYASVYGGWEETVKGNAPKGFNYKFSGLRLGGLYLLTPRLKLEGGVGAEQRSYRGQDVLFRARRSETFYDSYFGLDYAITRKLSLRPQYRYSHSDSTIPLRDYQRHTLSVNLRYELF